MAKTKRASSRRSPNANLYSKAWRQFLCELLSAKVRTKQDREDLAAQMGISIHYLSSMLYRQEGGIDAWASALSIAYDLKAKDIEDFFSIFKATLKKTVPLSKADHVWQRLDGLVDENEKFYWISMLHALVVADKDFRKK